jgi:SnoaL-like polyketide cyclase
MRSWVRWTARGTHTGTVHGLAAADVLGHEQGRVGARWLGTILPDGHRLSFQGVAVFRITNGAVAAVWLLLDEMQVLGQLRALPAAGPAD